MKKLLTIALFLVACGCHNSNPIIGTPKKLVNIDKNIHNPYLEIAEKDFPKWMTWDEAQAKCEELGKGWRLPNEWEQYDMYKNKDKIGGFRSELYWSYSNHHNGYRVATSFTDGHQDSYDERGGAWVRAVKD